jgi:hypothetical protein
VTNDKETLPSKVAQVEAADLNEEEMVLVIKRSNNTLKRHKDYSNRNKSKGKRAYFKCSKTGHILANCANNDDQEKDTKGKKVKKKKFYKKKKGKTHLGMEWDFDCSSFDSNDKSLATITVNKSHLFPNEHHTCLMAKERKVFSRSTIKYTSSSDKGSSDDEVDYSSLFNGFDILYDENDKFVNVEKAFALETKRINYCLRSYLILILKSLVLSLQMMN